jgi:hypothetical protein
MTKNRITLIVCALASLGACTEELPPRSVDEFIANPILLEATVVRCSQNRAETRYDPDCVNAREAVSRMAAREEQAGRADLEAQSERKRQALRRTQEAAAEARRRTAEANRRREEAAYLAQFGELPPVEAADPDTFNSATNAPGAVIHEPVDDEILDNGPVETPATDGGNAPTVEIAPANDLDQVRDELRRRSEESSSN